MERTRKKCIIRVLSKITYQQLIHYLWRARLGVNSLLNKAPTDEEALFMKIDFFSGCPLTSSFWVVNIFKCHLILETRHICQHCQLVPASAFCIGTVDCTVQYEWLYFCLELINSTSVGEESTASCMAGLAVLHNKLPTSTIRSSNDVGISSTSTCTQHLTTPEAGRNTSTRCQQSHVPAADFRQVLVLGYPVTTSLLSCPN